MNLELHRQLDLVATDVVADRLDAGLHVVQHQRVLVGFEARHLEVGGQRHLQNVDGLIGRPEGLVRAAQGHESGIKLCQTVGSV